MWVVTIMIGLVILAVVGGILASNWNLSDGLNALGFITSIISSIVLVALVAIFAFNHGFANSTVAKYNSIKVTIEEARENEVTDIERAALTQKIIGVNSEIASYKYWNGTMFHLMIPDKLADLEYLK